MAFSLPKTIQRNQMSEWCFLNILAGQALHHRTSRSLSCILVTVILPVTVNSSFTSESPQYLARRKVQSRCSENACLINQWILEALSINIPSWNKKHHHHNRKESYMVQLQWRILACLLITSFFLSLYLSSSLSLSPHPFSISKNLLVSTSMPRQLL